MILPQLKRMFIRLHDDENGDIPVGPILVIGLIVIPLVIALVAFGDELVKWFKGIWTTTKGKKGPTW